MTHGPAMTRGEMLAAVEAGVALVEAELAAGLDLAATGEMGIGNTTAAAALMHKLTGRPAPWWRC